MVTRYHVLHHVVGNGKSARVIWYNSISLRGFYKPSFAFAVCFRERETKSRAIQTVQNISLRVTYCYDNDVIPVQKARDQVRINKTIGSLSTRVFETRTATGSEHFACQDNGVSQTFILIICNGEKMRSNINVVV